MQLTNTEAKEALGALHVLAGEKLPIAGALRIRKLMRALDAHLGDVDAELRKIVQEYALKDDVGQPVPGEQPGSIKLIPELLDEAQARLVELWAATWETEHGVRVADLGTIDVTPETLLRLGPLLEDE